MINFDLLLAIIPQKLLKRIPTVIFPDNCQDKGMSKISSGLIFYTLHDFMGAKEGRHLRKLTTIPEPGQTSIKISLPIKNHPL